MTSLNKDILAQYYGDAPQQASDYESKPKRKKLARAPAKQLQGFKMVDDTEITDENEELTRALPQRSTPFRTPEIPFRIMTFDAHYYHFLSLNTIIEGDVIVDLSADTVKRELLSSQSQPQSFGSLDSSPPRRTRAVRQQPAHISSPYLGSPTVMTYSGDISPPRRVGAQTDSSPPRRPRSDQVDSSPPRKPREGVDLSPPRRRTEEKEVVSQLSTGDISPPRRRPSPESSERFGMKMTNGERAGLQTGAEITAEARRKRETELSRLRASTSETFDDGVTQTVYRDSSGRRIQPVSRAEEEEEVEEMDQQRRTSSDVGHRSSGRQDMHKRNSTDDGRSYRGRIIDDEELDARKRARDVWGDPLAQLKASGAIDSEDEDLEFEDPMRKFKKRKREHKKETKSRTFSGWFPPNRFNIRPGAQWDGVDRSNGFESKLHQSQLNVKHRAEEAYRYTSSDL